GDLGDLAAAHDHIVRGVDAGVGIEDVGAAHDDRGVGRGRADQPRRGHQASTGPGAAGSGATARAPASSSYSTAMRTTTPASTWAVITAWGESTTSPLSSTPRFTGPGCMSTWRGPSRRPSIW